MPFNRLCAVFALVLALPAHAHEFWIAPLSYQVESGATVQAHFRNGENFEGGTFAYFPQRSRRFDMLVGDEVIPLAPRPGDKPAFTLPDGTPEGLLVVVHETAPSSLTYRNWDKFLAFAAHKDFPNAAADHIDAGWPQDKFRESYTRHVKALIAHGDGAGADRALGLETEFIALTNPYDTSFKQNMKISLLYQGTPRPDAQVEVFEKAPDGTVAITLHRTDAEGQADIPVKQGYEYLFDAVVLRPADNPDVDPDVPLWETLWAALTFKVPAR